MGWSGLLSRMPLGAKIDEHDAIFRFNDAPTKVSPLQTFNHTTLALNRRHMVWNERDRGGRRGWSPGRRTRNPKPNFMT